MLRKVLLTGYLLSLSTIAQASPGLIGSWRFKGATCSSGAEFGAANGYQNNIQLGTLVITSSQVRANMRFQFKTSPEKAQEYQDQIAEAYAAVKQMPNGPEKTKAMASLKSGADMLNQFAKGMTCQHQSVSGYKVVGSTLHTVELTAKTVCNPPMPQLNDSNASKPNKNDIIEFALEGNILQTMYPASEEGDSACPAGDSQIETWERFR